MNIDFIFNTFKLAFQESCQREKRKEKGRERVKTKGKEKEKTKERKDPVELTMSQGNCSRHMRETAP